MPDIGWMELLVIGVVALIVVGPKDLPVMFRRMGQFMGRVRGMASDFQRAMDEAADDAGVSDLKRDLSSASKYANPKKMGMDALKETLDEIDPSKYADGSETKKVAEQKAAFQKRQRDLADDRRRARESETIAKKDAAAADVAQRASAEPANTTASDAEPEAEADMTARTGTTPP